MTNRSLYGAWPLLLTMHALAGCAASQPETMLVHPRPIGQDIQAYQAPETTEPAPPFVEPTGDLSLRNALEAALMNNPKLAVFSWTVRVKEADTLQAQLRPNPRMAFELENFGGSGELSGFEASEGTIVLSQLFEVGGKRGKRLALAARERDLAAWDYEAMRMDVLTETVKTFAHVLAAQERLLLATELVQVAEDGLASVSRRVRAGSVSPVEESRARVELATSRVDRDKVGRELALARQRLAATWGSSAPQFDAAAGDIEKIEPIPTLAAIHQHIAQTPELARWLTEIEQRRAALELARANGTPDVSIGVGVRRLGFTGADATAFMIGFEMPVPLFDRNQGASRAAEYRLQRATQEQRNVTLRVENELAILHQTLTALEGEVVALRDSVLPEARSAFETAQTGYSRGAMRFTDVLDTKRQLFELRARYFAALAEYHGAVADMERRIGESLDRIPEHAESTSP